MKNGEPSKGGVRKPECGVGQPKLINSEKGMERARSAARGHCVPQEKGGSRAKRNWGKAEGRRQKPPSPPSPQFWGREARCADGPVVRPCPVRRRRAGVPACRFGRLPAARWCSIT